MTLEQRIAALASSMGADIKGMRLLTGTLSALTTTDKTSVVAAINALAGQAGDLSALSTSAKSNLVAAINEVRTAVASGSSINDTTPSSSTSYSSSMVEARLAAVRDALLGGTPAAAYDTLKELADYVAADQTAAAAMATAIGYRVRFDDAQTLTVAQQKQACQNLGIGDPDTDFVAAYTAAKT